MFPYSEHTYAELLDICRNIPNEDLMRILESGASFRENRRHKSPRGLECAEFAFDITADFGAYRDLQRHRILTQERQLLTTKLGYTMPSQLIDTPMEAPFRGAMEKLIKRIV